MRIGGGGEGTVPEPTAEEGVQERLHGLLAALQGLARRVGELRARIEGDERITPEVEGRLLDLRGTERRLGAAEVSLRLVLEPGDQIDRLVRWLQLRGKGKRRNLVLAAAPIELGPVLREALFSKAETTVLTSATLTTRRRFDFLRGRLGLDDGGLVELERPLEVSERVVASPFDFAGQSLVVVPTDLPDPQTDPSGLNRETARVVFELAERTDGGILALFTSFRSLREVAEGLRTRGVAARWPLFVQGEADRSRLLTGFAGDGRGILLGTASFWEGVDVPGDPLRGLVIQRIPFRVPTEPVTAARVEALERRGGNAFYGYMLPLAALRLKQGFGRLIRRRSDRLHAEFCELLAHLVGGDGAPHGIGDRGPGVVRRPGRYEEPVNDGCIKPGNALAQSRKIGTFDRKGTCIANNLQIARFDMRPNGMPRVEHKGDPAT